MTFILYTFAGIFFLAKIYTSLKSCVMGLQSRHWPSVPGKILDSSMMTVHSRNDFTPRSRPVIEYEYFVNGKSYTGRNITAGGNNPTFARLPFTKEVDNPYKKDVAVAVFYDPSDPSVCSLERGVYWGDAVALLLFGLGFLILALPFFVQTDPHAAYKRDIYEFLEMSGRLSSSAR
jgi:Protein of unknown function (DUF3592)